MTKSLACMLLGEKKIGRMKEEEVMAQEEKPVVKYRGRE